jgi:hypothetical protein
MKNFILFAIESTEAFVRSGGAHKGLDCEAVPVICLRVCCLGIR